jgi:cell division protein FtsI (penicillin-binding protein 3)
VSPGRRRRPSASTIRLRRISAVAILLVFGLCFRLVLVQVLEGDRYAAYLRGEVEQKVSLPATRGAIYDRTGGVLAVSVQRTDVVADDFQINHPEKEASRLAPLLNLRASALARELSERNGYVVIARTLTNDAVDRVEAGAFAGLSFLPVEERVTPGDEVFQPVLGDVNTANVGYSGIEYADNNILAGQAGSEVAAVAPGGITLPTKPTDVRPPSAGTGVVLTLDEPLQVDTEREVAAQMRATGADSGIAVIMDVHTGAILAMVDLVRAHGAIVPASENLSATAIYQPGSVMKLATVSFALQDGLIEPSTVFTVPDSIEIGGYEFQDAELHPTQPMPVSQILAQSSNVGTIEIAQRLGEQRLWHALQAYGFGRPTGLDWPGESPGIIGSPATWYGSSAASVPIGTGVAVTPLQILDAYNAVANGGVFVTPQLVQGLVNNKGVEHLVAAHEGRRVITASTVRELIPMLEGVVQDGTAVLAHIPGYTVAGKTGTAQVPDPTGLGYVPGDWNATFVGFVPAQAPELSGIVVFNHPTPIYGGSVSAPVFSKIMQYALRRFDIAPPGPSTTLTSTLRRGGSR